MNGRRTVGLAAIAAIALGLAGCGLERGIPDREDVFATDAGTCTGWWWVDAAADAPDGASEAALAALAAAAPDEGLDADAHMAAVVEIVQIDLEAVGYAEGDVIVATQVECR